MYSDFLEIVCSPSIEGVGIDIVEIDRFRELDDMNSSFISRIFTSQEMQDAYDCQTPAQSLAGKFAAKEAVIKALPGSPLSLAYLPEIEIKKKETGQPIVDLPDEISAKYDTELSISHGKSYAVSFTIVFIHLSYTSSNMTDTEPDQIRSKVIEKIRKNRISTTEVADCLGKTGTLRSVRPLNQGHHRVGKTEFVYAYDESNWGLHKQIEEVPKDCILIVENHNCGDKALFGEIVTKHLILYQGVSGVVVNGMMRDASILYKEDYPIWAHGVTPIGCYNRPNEEPIDDDVVDEWRDQYEGGVAVCDDGGVVVIPEKELTQELLEKLEFIELQEDIWHYCVDTKKWSTYRTVCQKDYMDTELLPNELSGEFEKFVESLDLE